MFIRDKGIIYNDHLRTSDKVATTFPLNPSLTSKPVVSTGFIVADPSISFNNSRHKDYLVNRLSLPPLSTIDLSLSPSPRSIVYLEWPPRKVHLPESQYEGIAQDGSPRVHLHRRDNAIKRASLPLQSRGNDPFFFFSLPLPSLPLSFPLFLSFLFPSLLSLSLSHTPSPLSLFFRRRRRPAINSISQVRPDDATPCNATAVAQIKVPRAIYALCALTCYAINHSINCLKA